MIELNEGRKLYQYSWVSICNIMNIVMVSESKHSNEHLVQK